MLHHFIPCIAHAFQQDFMSWESPQPALPDCPHSCPQPLSRGVELTGLVGQSLRPFSTVTMEVKVLLNVPPEYISRLMKGFFLEGLHSSALM